MKENQNDMNAIDGVRLSPHFRLSEFLNLNKYPENIPTMQVVANLTYGCHQLLEPARLMVGPIIVNSGFRCEAVNRQVGGVRNSQHLVGQAADIRPKGPCAVPDARGVLQEVGVHRPAADGQRLAAHLLEPFRPAPPLCPHRLLSMIFATRGQAPALSFGA